VFYINRVKNLSNYSLVKLKGDVISGITVSLINLPLAMAFAIAIGVSPKYGLFTAIIAGGLQAIFGGSESNIAAPAGAFVGIVLGFKATGHNNSDVVVVCAMAGTILMAASLLRLGKLFQYVPYPVILGFTGGIGIIILKTQIAGATGIDLTTPTEIFTRWNELNFETFVVAMLTLVLIEVMSKFFPKWPTVMIGVVVIAALVYFLKVDIATVESQYGAIPRSMPDFVIPAFGRIEWSAFLPVAVAIAALAALESLLSASASDKMTGNQHNSNAELFGCGVANFVGPFFGGIPVCGAIAQTVLNARSGSHSWIAALCTALSLFAMVFSLAPMVGKIPLAVFAGVLIGIAVKLIRVRLYLKYLRSLHITDFLMVMITLLLTSFIGLTVGTICGLTIALVTYFLRYRSSKAKNVQAETAEGVVELQADHAIYFGNAYKTAQSLSRSSRPINIRFSPDTLYDASGFEALKDIKNTNADVPVTMTGVSKELKSALDDLGVSALFDEKDIQLAG